MAIAKLDLEKTYTVADYLSCPDDERREPIDGHPFLASPAPSPPPT